MVGNNWSLNLVIFEPGTTFKNPITGQVFTTDPALGYPSVTILQDLGDPDVQPNPDSTITDFCTPLSTNITTCGVTQDRSLMNRDNPCPSASGTKARQNPNSDTTANFVTYALGLPDADGDGLENSFDTCPYATNVDSPRITAGADIDAIDPACDLDNTVACWPGVPYDASSKFHTDCDQDGFVNSADNCPLVANPTQGKADADSDSIGDACDQNSGEAEGGRPLVVRVKCIVIGAGGGRCLGEGDIEADLSHISVLGGAAAPGDADSDGVLDAADNCPAVANAAQVDSDGDGKGDACDDSDGDGVMDAVDRCAGTPAGATVDAVGCTPQQAVLDDDKDAVLNAADKCPGTAAGAKVDADGCSAAQLAQPQQDTAGGGDGVGEGGVGALAPAVSSIPGWAAIASALGGAGLLGSLGAFASRIFRRHR